MKKVIIIFLVVVARLAMVVEVRAISYDTSYNQGILKIHTQGAPHLTKSGQIVNNWTAESMFTRIVWNADAGAPDWFGGKSCPDRSYNGLGEIRAAGFNTVFGPTSSEAVTLSKNAGLKIIMYVGGDSGPNLDRYKNMATS